MAETTTSQPVSSAQMRRQMLAEFWFYFSENRGAVIGQHLRTVGTAQHTRQVDDFQAFQGAGHSFHSSNSVRGGGYRPWGIGPVPFGYD
mgnify:CR=1 FL=1